MIRSFGAPAGHLRPVVRNRYLTIGPLPHRSKETRHRITPGEGATVPFHRLGGVTSEDWSADPPSGAAQPQARASTARRLILFLGNSYNSFSVACLQSLVESGYETIVGCYDSLTPGAWRLLRKSLKYRGWSFVLRKAARLIRSKARLALRRVGVPLSGFASLPELISTRRLNVIRCTDLNSAGFVDQVRRLGVDLIVVAGFGRILKKTLIGTPRLGCVNVHSSLLPRYRGPEPFYWVLVNRETTTGVTLHHVDEGIDSGDIILQRDLEILPNDTATTLVDRCAGVAAELLCEAIPLLLAGRAPRI